MFLDLAVMGMLLSFVAPQRLSAQWSADPSVNNAICTAAGDQTRPTIISDGAGGAIFLWEDLGTGADHSISLQRIDALGIIQWTGNGVLISPASDDQRSPAMTSDDSGGAIIAWEDFRITTGDAIYAQRINGSGSVQWPTDGVALCTTAAYHYPTAIASDGAGGAIITWVDSRSLSYHIYAQRVNSLGVAQWTAKGVVISTAANDQIFPTIVSDGTGGAIITWYDLRSGTSFDVYAQRINSDGVVRWTSNGVAISTAADDQVSPTITSDGAGGAIITWQDLRSGNNDIYAQRIDSAGGLQWTANGVAISTAANDQVSPIITSDDTRGAIITWQDARSGNYDIYAQRIDSAGVVQWTPNGVTISIAANDQLSPAITSDRTGGATITWQDARNDTSTDIYAQRIDHAGLAKWATDGVLVSKAALDQTSPAITVDAAGGVIITWQDARNGNHDIYAQDVDRFGFCGLHAPRLTGVRDVPGDQGGQVTVAWQRSDLDVYLGLVTSYSIWREIDSSVVPPGTSFVQSGEMSTKGSGNAYARAAAGPDTTYWQRLANVPSTNVPNYSFQAATLSDSTSGGMPYFKFIVWAQTSNQSIFWESNIDSGYSVDNLSPGPVTTVFAEVQDGPAVLLHWPPDVTDPDVSHYEVHRSINPNFKPTPLTRIGQTTDTMVVDSFPTAGAVNCYRILTVDVHENKSDPSPLAMASVSGTGQYNVSGRWNMVSIPLTLSDYHTLALFPTAKSSAYAYTNDRYVPTPVLANGRGYWLKFDYGQTIPMTGSARALDTIQVVAGWNLIGSISAQIDTSTITSIPGGIKTSRFYSYDSSGYKAATTIDPGKAYWIKSKQSGKLILAAQLHLDPGAKIHILPTEDIPPSSPDEYENSNLETGIPNQYQLEQNYPNPFNPTTDVQYAICDVSHVILKVFDVLGREIATLVNEVKEPGEYRVTWNAEGIPSGVYFYKMTATEFTDVKKMLMIK